MARLGLESESRSRPRSTENGGPRTAPASNGSNGRKWTSLAVVFPGAIAFALCCIDITGRSIWLDESASVSIASQHGAALWHAIARDGGNMSGYYVLLHVLISLFGDGLIALRLPSAIATGMTASLVALVATKMFDRTVGFAAGVLSALSLPLVFWGQDVRAYALMVAFVTASFYFLVELDSRLAGNGHSRWAWAGYLATTTIACYMSYVALLAVLAQVVWIVACRRPWKAIAGALAVAVVLWIPLLILAVDRGTGQLDWLARPGTAGLAVVLATMASASQQPNIHPTATSDALEALTAAIVVAGIALACWRPPRAPQRAAAGLLASWIAVPLVLAFAESYVVQPVFLSRNLLMCVPAVTLAASVVIVRPGFTRTAGLGALGLVGGLRIAQLAPSYGESSENWRAATSFVLDHVRSRDCVAFYPSDGRQAFDYYVMHTNALSRAPRPVLPTLALREVRSYDEVYSALSLAQTVAAAHSCVRLWLVSSHVGSRTGTASARLHFRRYEALLSELSRDFRPVAVTHFGWADPVRIELYRSTGAS